MTLKKCYKCTNTLSIDNFYKNKHKPDGLNHLCKVCDNKRKKVWITNNKLKHNNYVHSWYIKNKDLKHSYVRKRQELQLGIKEKKIYSKEDKLYTLHLFNFKCFNCGSSKNLTIDHHIPLFEGKGLTIKNAVVLCGSCNFSKGKKLPNVFYSEEQQLELLYLGIGDNWLW